MIRIEEIPVERINEYWHIQFQYLVDDGIITTDEEKEYFQSSDYREVLKGYMLRTPDTLHMIYFVRDGVRIGASQYCTYKSEDGKCLFWIFGFSLNIEVMERVTNVLRRFLSTQRMMVLYTMLSIMRKKTITGFGNLLDLPIMA